MDRDKPVDTIRLTPAERERLLESLEHDASASENQSNAREHARVGFRDGRIVVIFRHPGGIETRSIATPRNISVGGIGVLHGGFIHQDTECVVLLARTDGSHASLLGKTRMCRHVKGNVHEIGICFDKPIVLTEYVMAAASPPAA